MPEKISRRELGKATLLGAAALSLPAMAQQPTPPNVSEAEIEAVEKKLAKPLSPKAKEIIKGSLNDIKNASAARWEAKLPENSEPSFTYTATQVKK
jgi:hypothetical protein